MTKYTNICRNFQVKIWCYFPVWVVVPGHPWEKCLALPLPRMKIQGTVNQKAWVCESHYQNDQWSWSEREYTFWPVIFSIFESNFLRLSLNSNRSIFFLLSLSRLIFFTIDNTWLFFLLHPTGHVFRFLNYAFDTYLSFFLSCLHFFTGFLTSYISLSLTFLQIQSLVFWLSSVFLVPSQCGFYPSPRSCTPPLSP